MSGVASPSELRVCVWVFPLNQAAGDGVVKNHRQGEKRGGPQDITERAGAGFHGNGVVLDWRMSGCGAIGILISSSAIGPARATRSAAGRLTADSSRPGHPLHRAGLPDKTCGADCRSLGGAGEGGRGHSHRGATGKRIGGVEDDAILGAHPIENLHGRSEIAAKFDPGAARLSRPAAPRRPGRLRHGTAGCCPAASAVPHPGPPANRTWAKLPAKISPRALSTSNSVSSVRESAEIAPAVRATRAGKVLAGSSGISNSAACPGAMPRARVWGTRT